MKTSIVSVLFGLIQLAYGQDSSAFEKPVVSKSLFETMGVAPTYDNPKSFNNWEGVPGPVSVFKWQFIEEDHMNIPDEKTLDQTLPIAKLTRFESKKNGNLYASWLGHGTVLVHLDGVTFITDPIWNPRASVVSFMGPFRFRPPPMNISDLPKLDFGVISHDHYDHLDLDAVKKITVQNPSMQWFVPLGMGVMVKEQGAQNVVEMSWGDQQSLLINPSITIIGVPAQHWGQRGPVDRNKRLWSGYVVKGPTKRFFYAGDTGFCDKEFAKVGQKFGPFDLAAIPIGAYEPNWFMHSQHINPPEAVQVHELVKSKFSIGVHWGTYHMGSYEFYLEPRDKLRQLMAERGKRNEFVTIQQGTIWDEGDIVE